MRILIVAATEKEVSSLRKHYSKADSGAKVIDFLVTGVGMTPTAYTLTKRLMERKYDLALNIGIAGSFRHEIANGSVVNVVSDLFAEMGAEDGERFHTVFELGLQSSDSFPFWNGKIKNEHAEKYPALTPLKKVKAITVNKVHGSQKSINETFLKFNPDIETMEGAAFFYVCANERLSFLQLRAISNMVEPRNRGSWKIDLALSNLDMAVRAFLDQLLNGTR